MKIDSVTINKRRNGFIVRTRKDEFEFPFSKLILRPTAQDPISKVYVDDELGREAFTYVLESGLEDSIHLDAVLCHQQPRW